MWRCGIHPTFRPPCIWPGHSSVARRPCLQHLSSGAPDLLGGLLFPRACQEWVLLHLDPLPPPVGGPAAANGAPPVRQFHRLTPAEQLERRRQGLCFNCDEPYVRGHVCPRFFYLESDDYIDDGLGDAAAMDNVANPEAPDVEEPAAANALVVSLHALAGIRTDNTMLLPVMVKGERLLALLDTGSMHNFLHGATMRRLGLAPTGGEQLRVIVANGDRLPCEGIARHVPIRIGSEPFSITCVGLDLGCFDFILGVDYLRTLGPMLWDFEAMTLSFWREGKRVLWQGMRSHDAAVPQQHLAALFADAQQPLMDLLLQQQSAIFDEPTGLPLVRPYDHRIHLLVGTASVAVRPYRYPQLQKDELERQCAAMLAQGIIRPSTSPFSAPVLLVRKADKSWRFCID
ncbi:uncharacterized protein [Miscanthus floridulus]|uniref:uncharacterized protein n=1 Tax=Miscanthus floridulus TaxID=154761 RepID=UPI00345AF5A4